MIAERTLTLRTENTIVSIPIRVFAPERKKDDWECRYEIGWPEGNHVVHAAGIDSMQALVIALQLIGSEIYSSSYHEAGRLAFDARSRGYGFPVAAILRDQLVGDDRTGV